MTYLATLAAEIKEAVPSQALPDTDTSNLFLVYAVLLLAKGDKVSGEDVHNAWVSWMLSNGEQHESMAPWTELPQATKVEDSPFVVAIRTIARRHETNPA